MNKGNNNCVHKGTDRNPDYKEVYCFSSDEYACLECGWIADLNAYHKDVCPHPEWCREMREE